MCPHGGSATSPAAIKSRNPTGLDLKRENRMGSWACRQAILRMPEHFQHSLPRFLNAEEV